MVTLHPYQIQAVNNCRNAFAKNQRIILQSATGSGKSVMATEIVRMSAEKGKRILILTHRIEIFRAHIKHLSNANIHCEMLNSQVKHINTNSQVVLAMVETLNSRLKNGLELDFDFIVVDECHRADFSKIIEKYPQAYILGLSATPSAKHISSIYQQIITTIKISELIEKKYLVRCKPFEAVDKFDDLVIEGGEFTDESQIAHYNKSKLYKGAVSGYIEKGNGKPCIVYNINIEHCKKVHQEFIDAGIESRIITSETPDNEREQILIDFQDKKFPVINSIDTLSTGSDIPCVEFILINRAINSENLFIQIIGRGARPYKGKYEFIVLDLGGGFSRHGLWDEERKYTLKQTKKKTSLGCAPIRRCPQCDAMLSLMKLKCNYCGHEITVEQKELLEGQLREAQYGGAVKFIGRKIGDLNLEELFELQKSGKYKAQFIWRIVRSKGKESLFEYAKIAGYSKGWAFTQMKTMNQSVFTNIEI